MKIVFMGTPDFAVATLARLIDAGYDIVGVLTAPDRKAGRGQKVKKSAVKIYAEEKGLTILQPTNLKNPEFQKELHALKADIQVVVAFRMLPEAVWNMPSLGSVNLHASILPNYRGAAPINWAVINGEKETGVSTFFLQHEIDTGKIIFQEKVSINSNDTAGIVHDKLMDVGADLMVKTMNAIKTGEYPQIEQDHIRDIKHAPKIFKPDCEIDWSKTGEKIHNHIRGLSPYPTAWTKLDGKNVKIFETTITDKKPQGKSGQLFIEEGKLYVNTNDSVIEIFSLQLEGKKRMKTADFMRGFQQEKSNLTFS